MMMLLSRDSDICKSVTANALLVKKSGYGHDRTLEGEIAKSRLITISNMVFAVGHTRSYRMGLPEIWKV